MDWEFGVGRCKLLSLEWINNKVVMCSTVNYIEYPVINHTERNIKKNVYNWVTLLYSRDCHNIAIQLYSDQKKKRSAF